MDQVREDAQTSWYKDDDSSNLTKIKYSRFTNTAKIESHGKRRVYHNGNEIALHRGNGRISRATINGYLK